MQMRWPLHPKPQAYETLEPYVRRLAACYGVRYENFCLHALGIAVDDSQARHMQNPTSDILRRLSEGTGISVAQLELMTWPCIWERLLAEMSQYTATSEGQAALAVWEAVYLQKSKVTCLDKSLGFTRYGLEVE